MNSIHMIHPGASDINFWTLNSTRWRERIIWRRRTWSPLRLWSWCKSGPLLARWHTSDQRWHLKGGVKLKTCWRRTRTSIFSTNEVLDINPNVMTHHLKINPDCKPIKHKKRNFALEKQRSINQGWSRQASQSWHHPRSLLYEVVGECGDG